LSVLGMRTRRIVDVIHGSKQIKCLKVPAAFVMASATFALAMFPQLPVFANASASGTKPSISKGNDKGAAFLNRAIQLYQRNSFKEAELFLRQSIAENPTSADAHYYLANALVQLNRHDEAIEEFKRAYRSDPFGPTSGYCRKALQAYAEKQATAKPGDDDNTEAIDATSSMMRYAQKGAGKDDSQLKLVTLREQVEREKLRHQQSADSYGRAMRSTGEGEALTIRANARDDIDRILHGTRGGLPWVQQAAEARAAEVQHNADELEKIARERASEKAAEYKSVSKAKGRALDETVTNLEHQLVTKTLPGTPVLKHDGTDLFVRSYSPSSQKSPYPDAHAAVARINPVHIDHSKDDADDNASAASSGNAVPVHDVKGKVLN
jgi:tetratricopeptide (TPR) repeat protein